MYEKWQKIVRPEASLFAGVLFVALLGFLRPYQKDLAHVVGVVTAGGGMARHGAHFELGGELFGKDTIFVTASITPPIQGDLHVELTGPEAIDYQLSSRYPPGVPLLNRNHAWYRFEGDTIKGVQPGDDLIVVVTMRPPSAPGKYDLVLSDAKSGRPYLTVPVIFGRQGEEMQTHGEAVPAGTGAPGGTDAPAGGGAPAGTNGSRPAETEETAPADSGEVCH